MMAVDSLDDAEALWYHVTGVQSCLWTSCSANSLKGGCRARFLRVDSIFLIRQTLGHQQTLHVCTIIITICPIQHARF